MSDRPIPTINDHPVDYGCIIDGNWGQYGPDRLTEIAEGLGCPLDGMSDPRTQRRIANYCEARMVGPKADQMRLHAMKVWDRYHDAADRILDWMNDNAVGCVVEWIDGECFIIDLNDEEAVGDAHD